MTDRRTLSVVGFIVREDQNGRMFYDHEMTKILPGPPNTAAAPKGNDGHVTGANQGDARTIFRDCLGVNDGTFMLELTDANGATVVAPVLLQAQGRLGVQINIVKSVYAKENNGVPNNTCFKNQVEKNARHINRAKWKSWETSAAGAASPWVVPRNFFEKAIFYKEDLVNLRQQNSKLHQTQDGLRAVRGQVGLTDPDKNVISIFKGSDLSTIPHDTAHIFLCDPLTAAGDDGSIARGRLREDLKAAGLAPAPFADLLDVSLSVDDARAMLRGTRDDPASLGRTISDVRISSRRTRERLCQSGWQAEPMDMQVREQDRARRRHLLAEERVMADFVRHMDGLEQAGRDVRTLRRFAGLPEEGR